MSRLPTVHPRLVKVRRTPRVTMRQLEALVDRLEHNPCLHKKKKLNKQGEEIFESGWKKVSDYLNSIPNGSVKTPAQWITVWRDFKSRIYNKAANIEGDRHTSLSKLEEKVIALIRDRNDTYTTFCPDAAPAKGRKKENLKDDDDFPESQFIDFQLIVTETDEEDSVEIVRTKINDSMAPEEEEEEELPEETPISNEILCNTPLQPPVRPTARRTSKIASPSPASEASETSVPELNLREQRDTIRKELLTIVTSNAESMQMLATAAKVQAEASKMHAEVAKVQAETTLLLAQAINKTGDTLVNLINKS